MDFKEKMEKLIAELNNYNYHYYTLDQPLVSDKDMTPCTTSW